MNCKSGILEQKVDVIRQELKRRKEEEKIADREYAEKQKQDFIFDPYQVYEARAYGADALLLIVAILSPGLLKELLDSCRKLWMQALVEVHNLQELEWAIDAGAEIIGVNNRDLRTFETSLSTTEELVTHFPNDKIIVSESGINSSEDISKLHRMGVHAALVGEAIVTQEDPGAKIRELIGV